MNLKKSKSPIFDVNFYMSELKKRKKRMCHYRSTRWSSLIAPRRFGFVSVRDSDNTIVLLMVTRLSGSFPARLKSSFFLSGYFFLSESLILSTPYSIESVTPVSYRIIIWQKSKQIREKIQSHFYTIFFTIGLSSDGQIRNHFNLNIFSSLKMNLKKAKVQFLMSIFINRVGMLFFDR